MPGSAWKPAHCASNAHAPAASQPAKASPQPDGTWYYNLSEANLDRIVSEHLKNGRIVEDLIFHQGKPLNEAENPPQ